MFARRWLESRAKKTRTSSEIPELQKRYEQLKWFAISECISWVFGCRGKKRAEIFTMQLFRWRSILVLIYRLEQRGMFEVGKRS